MGFNSAFNGKVPDEWLIVNLRVNADVTTWGIGTVALRERGGGEGERQSEKLCVRA